MSLTAINEREKLIFKEQKLFKLFMEGNKLSKSQIIELEAKIKEDPSNLYNRVKALGDYTRHEFDVKGNTNGEAEWCHVSWLIQNYPDSSIYIELLPVIPL